MPLPKTGDKNETGWTIKRDGKEIQEKGGNEIKKNKRNEYVKGCVSGLWQQKLQRQADTVHTALTVKYSQCRSRSLNMAEHRDTGDSLL